MDVRVAHFSITGREIVLYIEKLHNKGLQDKKRIKVLPTGRVADLLKKKIR